MKKIVSIILIITMVLSCTACSNKVSAIDPNLIHLEYLDEKVENSDGSTDLKFRVYVDSSFEGKSDDIYSIYYSFGDDYKLCNSSKLHNLKTGMLFYFNYNGEDSKDLTLSVVIAKEDVSSIENDPEKLKGAYNDGRVAAYEAIKARGMLDWMKA